MNVLVGFNLIVLEEKRKLLIALSKASYLERKLYQGYQKMQILVSYYKISGEKICLRETLNLT